MDFNTSIISLLFLFIIINDGNVKSWASVQFDWL